MKRKSLWSVVACLVRMLAHIINGLAYTSGCIFMLSPAILPLIARFDGIVAVARRIALTSGDLLYLPYPYLKLVATPGALELLRFFDALISELVHRLSACEN